MPRCHGLRLATQPPCMLARSTCLAAAYHIRAAVMTSVAYDPVANEWTPKRRMPEASQSASAHTIGDKIYVVMGNTSLRQLQNGLYAYDPGADAWSARAARPTYRSFFASAVVNGRLYVIGGQGMVDNGPSPPVGSFSSPEAKSHVEIYDPATNSWSTGAPVPTALHAAQACVVGGQIHLFGGTSGGPFERSILTYSPTSNSWSAKSPMPNLRVGFACTVVDDAVYLVGGYALGPGRCSTRSSATTRSWRRGLLRLAPRRRQLPACGGDLDGDSFARASTARPSAARA